MGIASVFPVADTLSSVFALFKRRIGVTEGVTALSPEMLAMGEEVLAAADLTDLNDRIEDIGMRLLAAPSSAEPLTMAVIRSMVAKAPDMDLETSAFARYAGIEATAKLAHALRSTVQMIRIALNIVEALGITDARADAWLASKERRSARPARADFLYDPSLPVAVRRFAWSIFTTYIGTSAMATCVGRNRPMPPWIALRLGELFVATSDSVLEVLEMASSEAARERHTHGEKRMSEWFRAARAKSSPTFWLFGTPDSEPG